MRARLQLGSWPSPYQPDPKSLGFDFHHLAIYLGIPAMSVAGICAVVLALRQTARSGRGFPWPTMICVGLGGALVIALALADPGGYFTWFCD